MHIAIITAGGAGMFCGSCMHDNTWARALISAGARVSLIPTYTPIRVDEEDVSRDDVHFGGIGVYLGHRVPGWRRLPRKLTRWLDRPWVIRLVTQFGVSTDARHLGALTLEMLAGDDGPHAAGVTELAELVADELKPDIVCFSNSLLAGAVSAIKQRFDVPVLCVLQGDDVFLEGLTEPYRTQAIETIHDRCGDFDGFLVHSDYYRDFMVRYLGLDQRDFHRIPLGIDLELHDGEPVERGNERFTVGYFARICPEKGLDRLIEAFRILHRRHPDTRLIAGGWLGKSERRWFRGLLRGTRDLGDAFEYIGSPRDTPGKVSLLKSLDVLSVPTVYREPKGLYVLEAMANGVPVVQPDHGAFPELIEATGGGLLVDPGNAAALADVLEQLKLDPARRIELAAAGQAAVRRQFAAGPMAAESLDLFRRLIAGD